MSDATPAPGRRPPVWAPPQPAASLLGQVPPSGDPWPGVFALAEAAAALDEIPVGAVVTDPQGRVVGLGHDLKMAWSDPTAHAEVIALRQAAAFLGDWRLDDCTLYVSLEPCAMCAGAILLARIHKVVWAASSPKFGAIESQARLLSAGSWNHTVESVRAPESEQHRAAAMLRAWFRRHRRAE